jgi:hypothetical protein
MVRRRAKVDANQGEIVLALQTVGCSVLPLVQLGGGVPDLLVGHRGRNYLLEVKRPGVRGKKRGLYHQVVADRQQRWHDAWQGQADFVETVEQALAVVMEE